MKKRIVGALFVICFVVIVAAVFLLFFSRNLSKSNINLADQNAYFNMSDSDGTDAAIVINQGLQEAKALIRDGEYYLPIDLVSNQISSRFYYDEIENSVLFALPVELLSFANGSVHETVSGNGGIAFLTEGDTNYLALSVVEAYTPLVVNTYEEPNRVCIQTEDNVTDVSVVKAKKDTQVLISEDKRANALTDVEKGDSLRLIEAGEDWTRVATKDGFSGYIRNKEIGDVETETTEIDFSEPDYSSISYDEQICMGWHQVTNATSNAGLEGIISSGNTLNVISPTWFFCVNTDGWVENLADADYVNQAHQAGLKVWATINDFDGQTLYGGINSTDETLALLRSRATRQVVIEQVVGKVLEVGADGINIDFEKISEECGPHYVQFIREMSIECRKYGLVLSVDQYVPSAWSKYYNRKEQSVFADYVIIMAYDENGSWSEEIGPNSSLDYVSDAITDSLEEGVAADKLVIALPFYTKLWEEDGTGQFSVTSISMQQANELIATHSAVASYDDVSGQNMVSYEENGNLYTMWLEDADSVSTKLSMIKEHDLAGAAFWKLGQEDSAIWSTIAVSYMPTID